MGLIHSCTYDLHYISCCGYIHKLPLFVHDIIGKVSTLGSFLQIHLEPIISPGYKLQQYKCHSLQKQKINFWILKADGVSLWNILKATIIQNLAEFFFFFFFYLKWLQVLVVYHKWSTEWKTWFLAETLPTISERYPSLSVHKPPDYRATARSRP